MVPPAGLRARVLPRPRFGTNVPSVADILPSRRAPPGETVSETGVPMTEWGSDGQGASGEAMVMTWYGWLWESVASLMCLLGLAAGVSAIGLTATAVLFACGAAVGVLVAYTYAMIEPLPIGTCLWCGLVAGGFTAGGIGGLAVFGPIWLAGLVVVGVAAPRTVRQLRRLIVHPPDWKEALRWLDPAADEQKPTPPVGNPAELAEMTDRDLCAMWRRSYGDLKRTPEADARLELVRLRAACLNEMERRHPQAFSAWLASRGARPGDPPRFTTAAHS